MTKKPKLLRQNWLESERGWGIRPDGYTLHMSVEDRKAFVSDYWSKMPDQVPDEYSRPCGEPNWVEVDKQVYTEVKDSEFGIWYF